MTKNKKVILLHPDLGIGGAERLVVDAALALKNEGHSVYIITTHHDKTHCFNETKDGSLPVTVVGDWIPRNIFGICFALCAYVRMIYAALYIVLFCNIQPDIIFCDIVSACIPVLRLCKCFVIYYCHFPDQLLSAPGSKIKTIYRAPLNWIEEKTTGCADMVLVNSKFTQMIFKQTFRSITTLPEILYPSINTEYFDKNYQCALEEMSNLDIKSDNFVFLSINRYERKKNIGLSIAALASLKVLLNENEFERVLLVIAGGYDSRVLENLEYYDELKELSKSFNVEEKVLFLKSPPDLLKINLLMRCDCLLYTPDNEHFGIVPLEAMYSQKPVIAVNSGGPTETVISGETGFLCNSNPKEFSSSMAKYVKNHELAHIMGKAGRQHFEDNFSFTAFQYQLNEIIKNNLISSIKKDM